MNFPIDIYISYCLKDNNMPSEHGIGWVANFQRFLETLLLQILGEKPTFLNYSNHEKPSKTELDKVGIFISILSPDYIKHQSSLEEINDFFELTNRAGNLMVNGRERIFKVVKFPVPLTDQPSKIANLLAYDLFDTDAETGQTIEFVDYFNSEAERKYWLKMVDLAYDIAELLKNFKNLDLKNVDFSVYSEKNVYLAEAGLDLQPQRDSIKRELTRHGFRVLPDHALPGNLIELELNIKKDIERSRLSIHLVGDGYGEYAPNADKSILDLQNQIAAEYSLLSVDEVNRKFSRLIWISPDAKLDNEKQKMFIENIRRDLEANEGAEILHSPIEDFKMVILEELLNLKINTNNGLKSKNKKQDKCIYLIFDKIDEFEAKKIQDFLNYKGYQAISPTFEGELLDLREIHLENLRICDAALIYINKVNDLWVQMKFLDLLKAPGMGREKPDLYKTMLLGKNLKENAGNFEKFDIPVIHISENIENSLLSFTNDFKP